MSCRRRRLLAVSAKLATPVVFLTGSSSVGKSRILLQLHQRGHRILSADDVLAKVQNEVSQRWRQDPTAFADDAAYRQEVERIGLPLLVRMIESSPQELVFVDDVLHNMKRYLPLIHRPVRTIMIFAPLPRLLRNLMERDEKEDSRMASRVLGQLMELYEPILPRPSGRCATKWQLHELEAFDEIRQYKPYGFISKRLPTAMRQFRKRFFSHGRKTVCVRPSSTLDVPVDLVVKHERTLDAVDAILEYTKTF